MRFLAFVKHCELNEARLEALNKQVVNSFELSVVNDLKNQQLNKLKLLPTAAVQKNCEFEKQLSAFLYLCFH